jgi:RNA polymerase sigma-70 factor (ECF subfamily)
MHDANPGSSDGRWTAFEAEAMPHVDRLFRLAMWWERNRGDAEDLVQDTLVQALQSFDRFTPGTNCRAWLITILRHVRSNRRRTTLPARRWRIGRSDRETVPFVPPCPSTSRTRMCWQRSREYQLPGHHPAERRRADIQEIATALTIPIGTVMSRLHRGRALLRQRLVDAGDRGVEQRLDEASAAGSR